MPGAGVTADHTGTALGAAELVLTPVQQSVCKHVWRWTTRPEKAREEQEQGQAGVSELCWGQPQLGSLYDSKSKALGSGGCPGWRCRERKHL